MGGASANSLPAVSSPRHPPPPTPPRHALRARGEGRKRSVVARCARARRRRASRFATSPLAPRVEARARCAAASPPARRSQELSGGGCRPVEEPMPLSPRLIAGLSSSASAGPIGCTSGRDALSSPWNLAPSISGFCRAFWECLGSSPCMRIWDEFRPTEKGKALARSVPVPLSAAGSTAQSSSCEHGSRMRILTVIASEGLISRDCHDLIMRSGRQARSEAWPRQERRHGSALSLTAASRCLAMTTETLLPKGVSAVPCSVLQNLSQWAV